MKNIRFLYQNYWDVGTLTYSSQNANFPASNTRHRWWTKAWRSTGITSEWLKNDLGAGYAAYPMSSFAMKYNNFTTSAVVTLEASEDDFSTVSYSTILSPIDQDIMGVFFGSAETYRYWRLTVADTTNTAAYLTIGRIFLGPYWTPTVNFDIEYSEEHDDPSVLLLSEGGQISGVIRTQFKTQFYWFANQVKLDRDKFVAMFKDRGMLRDLFVCKDADDDYSAFLYARIAQKLPVRHILLDDNFAFPMVFEELR